MKLKKSVFYNVIVLIKEIICLAPVLTILSLLIPFIGGGLSFYTYTSQVNIINIIAENHSKKNCYEILKLASIPFIIYTAVYILQAVSTGVGNIVKSKMNIQVTLLLKKKITDVTCGINYEYFDDDEFCNKLERAKSVVGDELTNIINYITTSVNLISQLISIIWLSATTGYYNIVIIVILMMIVNLSLKLYTEIRVRKYGKEVTLDGRIADYLSKRLAESNSIIELRLYNSLQFFIDKWKSTFVKQNKKRYGARRFEIKMGIVVILIQSGSILYILLSLLKTIRDTHNVAIGTISVLFLALISCGDKIMTLTWPLSKLYIVGTKFYDLNEILKMKTSNQVQEETKNADTSCLPIVFDNVSFQYARAEKCTLKDINFTLKKHDKIALVGENGAGKSTLIRLLMDQYNASQGKITWNGKDKLSGKVSVVFQNFIKFNLSLRENVALGNVEEFYNDERILKTLEKCDLGYLVEEVGGLDKPLGKLMEGGKQLSGGQWQKLAIARAMFNDAELIVFDEPTSAIDPNAEAVIINRLLELCEDKTAVFISHRMGWAKNVDQIIVMDNGRIAERGTHKELLQKNGIYANMYNIQASWYI